MQIGEFTLQNPDKIERAINGTLSAQGLPKGGVGPDDPAAIIAEYDRLGGHITKGTYKVKPGSFYDFKNKKVFATPKPKLVFRIEGEDVEVDADEPLPLDVRAAVQAGEKKAARAKAKQDSKKGGKKSEATDEATENDAEEEEGELA